MNNESKRFCCPRCGQLSSESTLIFGAEVKCSKCGKSFKPNDSGVVSSENPNALVCYFRMFKRYRDFKGRIRRREFWRAFLLNEIVCFILAVLGGLFCADCDVVEFYLIVSLLPMLAIQVRRLHDTNKSGLWVLLSPVPVLNIAYLVWLATDGDKGGNRFGADPKGKT